MNYNIFVLFQAIQTALEYERLHINPSSTLSDPAVLCTHPSSGGEFQVMIKKGLAFKIYFTRNFKLKIKSWSYVNGLY